MRLTPQGWIGIVAVVLVGLLIQISELFVFSAAIHPSKPPHPAAAAARPTPTTTPTPTARPTAAPTPTPTPVSTATPDDPRALTVEHVRRSIHDNQGDAVANFDHLNVLIDNGSVRVEATPDNLSGEEQTFTLGAWDAWVASRAILGFYPAAQSVTIAVRVSITDVNGQKSVDDGVRVTVTAATAQGYDYSGLQGRIINDSTNMYLAATGFDIAGYIWKRLNDGQRQKLGAPVKA